MASKPVGRGRGLGRGWLQVFQPNPCPVNVEGIGNFIYSKGRNFCKLKIL